ncbi:MAG: CPBP family intramembrane metalloprotease [Spirochaetaceae bacterium]|nr:CPBP family intramembrane metalloprotease [Spirochaetaceae bacterium]
MYALLFLPGAASRGFFFGTPGATDREASRFPEPLGFDVSQALSRLFGYTIPAIALIVCLLVLRGGKTRLPGPPGSRDIRSAALALPGLFGAGLFISFISLTLFPGAAAVMVEAPQGLPAVIVMFFSCLGAGYLEEFYFRYYLSLRFKEAGLSIVPAIGLSALLFSICHLYEGPWGALNAFLAGVLLSLVYKKYRGLHGIAWAHSLYNVFVYLNGV